MPAVCFSISLILIVLFLPALTVLAGDVVLRNFTLDAALDNRDAMSKAIYQRLFSWIVTTANEVLTDNKKGRCAQE